MKLRRLCPPRFLLIVLLIVLLVAVTAVAASAAPVPRGDRILEIDVGFAEDGDFFAAFEVARAVGMQSATVSIDWTDFEIAPRVYRTVDDPDNVLPIVNLFYPAFDMPVTLTVRPVVTLARSVPPDLAGTAFDDPRHITRFNRMLDRLFRQIRDVELTAFSIGSEFDIMFGADAELWRQYTRFFEAAYAHIRSSRFVQRRWPDLVIGAEATFALLLNNDTRDFLLELNRSTDALFVSYYPLSQGRVLNPKVVRRDFDDLVALYPDKPIYFLQLGYPSGYFSRQFYDADLVSVLGSSQGKQSRFIKQVFRAWDRHAEQIRMIDFTWLTDLSRADAEFFANESEAFAVPGDPAQLEFLHTLGLRTYPGAGRDKKAFKTLRAEAAARGWGVGAAGDGE